MYVIFFKEQKFNLLDFVFIDGDPRNLPWMTSMQKVIETYNPSFLYYSDFAKKLKSVYSALQLDFSS
jgi:hypothetical protein